MNNNKQFKSTQYTILYVSNQGIMRWGWLLSLGHFSTDFCTACSKKEVHFNTEEFSGTTTPPGETLPPRTARSSAAALRQSSFNIFDGTNATGGFSEFVHGGDSDDEEADNNETKHWNTIQDHV